MTSPPRTSLFSEAIKPLQADLFVLRGRTNPKPKHGFPQDWEIHVNPLGLGTLFVGGALTLWLLQLKLGMRNDYNTRTQHIKRRILKSEYTGFIEDYVPPGWYLTKMDMISGGFDQTLADHPELLTFNLPYLLAKAFFNSQELGEDIKDRFLARGENWAIYPEIIHHPAIPEQGHWYYPDIEYNPHGQGSYIPPPVWIIDAPASAAWDEETGYVIVDLVVFQLQKTPKFDGLRERKGFLEGVTALP